MTQTIEITNLNQIVKEAQIAADVATDVMNTPAKMEILRNTALFMLTEEVETHGWKADHEALHTAFVNLYDDSIATDEDCEIAAKATEAVLESFQERCGDSQLFKLLFWTHFICEVQEVHADTLKNAKEAGFEGAHKAHAILRVQGNVLVSVLGTFQDRLLA